MTVLSCTESTSADVDSAAQNMASHNVTFKHVAFTSKGSSLLGKARSFIRPCSELLQIGAFRTALDAELRRQPEIVHAEHLHTSYAIRGGAVPVFTYVHHLDTIDWEHRTDLTRSERATFSELQRATRRDVRANDHLITATDRLKRRSIEMGAKNVITVPVALDLAQYPLQPTPSAPPVVGVIGSMDSYPSRSAAERVIKRLWPRIHQQVPDARLVVAGHQSKEFLSHLFPVDGGELIGEVAHPIDFFGQVSALLYPPVRGSGMKIKVLEAMAYGVPVVSNSEGFEGLEIVNGEHGAMAESDDEFVEATVQLLQSDERRETIRTNARALMEQRYSAKAAVNRLLTAYGKNY